MNKVKEKLKSSAGVTAIFALGVVLLATLVSVAMVDSALNNAKRVRGQRQEQSENLIVSSAATLMRQTLAGETVTITQTLDAGRSKEIDDRVYEGGNELAQSLATAMLATGSFSDTLTMAVGNREEMQLEVETKFSGSRLTMSFKPADTDIKTANVILYFEGMGYSRVDTPYYELEVVEEVKLQDGTVVQIYDYVLKHWTRVTCVSFSTPANIHVEALDAKEAD